MDYNKDTRKILFGGDLYCNLIDVKISPALLSFFREHDQAVLNLEAPFLNNNKRIDPNAKSGPSIYQGNFSLDVLKKLDMRYVGGANNHIMDAGCVGLQSTKEVLQQNSIKYFGFGMNLTEAAQAIELGDTGIFMLGVGEEEFGVADEERAGMYSMYDDSILDKIRENKDRYLIVIYAHGGPENEPLSSFYVSKRYKQFIDCGAKLVVGHHPHVVQGFEEYHGGYIFYSLGNFFHEMYLKNVGALLSVEIASGKISKFSLKQIMFCNGQLDLVGEDEKFKSYLTLNNSILKNNYQFKQIYQEQAIAMYHSYYGNYFLSLFSYRFNWLSRLRLMLEKFVGNYKNKLLQIQKPSQSLLLNLIRNKSHQGFIEMALKIKLGEELDLRDEQSALLYKKLKDCLSYE